MKERRREKESSVQIKRVYINGESLKFKKNRFNLIKLPTITSYFIGKSLKFNLKKIKMSKNGL